MKGQRGADPSVAALRQVGKVTGSRLALLNVLQSAPSAHWSATTLQERCREAGMAFELSTVYRTMTRFVAGGLAHLVVSQTGTSWGSGPAVHGHARCARCAAVRDLDGGPVELGTLLPTGWTVGDGPVLMALCAQCSASV